jgi:hypothetical protein|tara:strand:+ start:423 stop:581 length:159 start_codon:yes stop_codon:yes gene_type:complete
MKDAHKKKISVALKKYHSCSGKYGVNSSKHKSVKAKVVPKMVKKKTMRKTKK